MRMWRVSGPLYCTSFALKCKVRARNYLWRSDWCPAIPSQFPPSLLSESEQEEIQLVSALVIVTYNWEQSVFTALTLRPGLEIDCN